VFSNVDTSFDEKKSANNFWYTIFCK